MLTAQALTQVIGFTFLSHNNYPTKPSKAFRKWDGQTPYGVHPAWCALTLLHETALPKELRVAGAIALAFHDLLEDTTADLPADTSKRVRALVEGMTFRGGSAEEMEMVWERGTEILLLKLYDKVSNLLDGQWMDLAKAAAYKAYTLKLADVVQKEYGPLAIIKIAQAVCADN